MAKQPQYELNWTQGKQGSEDAFFVRATVFVVEQGFQVEFDDLDKVSWHLTVYDGEEPIGASIRTLTASGSWAESAYWKNTAAKKSAD